MTHIRRRPAGRTAVAVTCLLSVAGCGTMRLVAPEGREVRMLSRDAPAQVHIERTVWFWLWGAKPISDNTTRQDIEQYNLREVRYETHQTLFETITNPITAIVSVSRRTLIVEGNP